MKPRILACLLVLPCLAAMLAIGGPASWAQEDAQATRAETGPREAKAELSRALAERRQAERRASKFSREADAAGEAAEKAARKAAALAAEIQAAEADIIAARARIALARSARDQLRARLAERQQPLARLIGALQTNARRPLALSALQPGSLKDLVHVRAVLASTVPEIRQRTSTLRAELAQGELLESRAARALADLRASEGELLSRRAALGVFETRQRLVSSEARGIAAREQTRALALAEEARDLDGLITQLDKSARLRRDLARLPGPIFRPEDIGMEIPEKQRARQEAIASESPDNFRLPAQGRIVAGFGERRESGLRTTGVTIAPSAGAQVVAPGAGRVAFAGTYRGFGRIVIIEHGAGWTSLVTGLARVQAQVGDSVIAGAPLGVAGQDDPALILELRREGEPVNPLAFLR